MQHSWYTVSSCSLLIDLYLSVGSFVCSLITRSVSLNVYVNKQK